MIPKAFHCLLREHSKKDFKTGAFCGLTNEKPKFLLKCPNKEFGNKLEQEIIEVNKELAVIKITKTKTILHVYTYLSFAVIVLISTYFFTIYLWEKGWMTSITLTIGTIGLGLIPMAIAPLNKYKRSLKVAMEGKQRLDDILKMYKYTYDFDISIKNGPHDILDIKTQVKIQSKLSKNA